MSYPKTQWIAGAAPGVSAALLNKIEQGIYVSNQLSDAHTAGGTATAITLPNLEIANYYTGLKVTFVASANNNGSPTTINVNGKGAKNVYRPGTTIAPNLKSGRAYTLWYNGTSFFWQASAEGDAVVANVLAGKIFSNDDDSGLVGTMPDRAGNNANTQITRSGTTLRLRAPVGFYDGVDDTVDFTNANYIAENIKQGVTFPGNLVGSALGLFNNANTTTTVTSSTQFSSTEASGVLRTWDLLTLPSDAKFVVFEPYSRGNSSSLNDNTSSIYGSMGGGDGMNSNSSSISLGGNVDLTLAMSGSASVVYGYSRIIIMARGENNLWVLYNTYVNTANTSILVSKTTGVPNNLTIKIKHQHFRNGGTTSIGSQVYANMTVYR